LVYQLKSLSTGGQVKQSLFSGLSMDYLRLIYDFAMALLWLYYDFTSSTPYVKQVERIDDKYIMKKGCNPEVRH